MPRFPFISAVHLQDVSKAGSGSLVGMHTSPLKTFPQ